MTAPGRQFKTIDEYIGTFPPGVQDILERLRETIHETAPDAEEAINYGIPTFTLNGNLVHFAAFAHHIGFYPTPSAIEAFRKELAPYKTTKGTVRFPIDEPIPLELVRRMVQFRVKENLEGRRKKRID
jgi:uncharacterized protein YdhG (YjbR/CyaY superfamily)